MLGLWEGLEARASNGEATWLLFTMGLDVEPEEKGLAFELSEMEKGFDNFAPDRDVRAVAKRLSPRFCCEAICSVREYWTGLVTIVFLFSFMF